MVDGFAAGIGQFAVGMLGLRKLQVAGSMASTALSVGKAALVGAVAFDPFEARLSNLIQTTWMANPLNDYLAASPDDSAATGRMKAAFESIGLDAAIGTVFLGVSTALKHYRAGQVAQGNAALDAVQAAADDAHSAEQAPSSPSSLPSTPPQADPNVEVSRVDSPTQAAAADGVNLKGQELPTATPKVKVGIENTQALIVDTIRDANAISKHGGWYEAIQAGHTFGQGEKVPYRYLNSDASVDDFVARVVDATKEQLDKIKGGDVIGDAKARAQMLERVKLYGVDPFKFLGVVQQMGASAKQFRASYEGGMVVATKLFQDCYALSMRIGMGDHVGFGSREEALKALETQTAWATSIYGSAQSLMSNSGRTLRAGRGAIDAELVAKMKETGGEQLAYLFKSTNGNLRNMFKIANPSLLGKVRDYAQHLLINNLVSGPITHAINITGGVFTMGMRPLSTMLGSVLPVLKGEPINRQLLARGAMQYVYMGSSLEEALRPAYEAFLKNDSLLAPHVVDTSFGAASSTVKVIRKGDPKPKPGEPPVSDKGVNFKPLTSTTNLMYNALLAGSTVVGVPVRSLGTVDELLKQIVYRSHLKAKAHVEGVQAGVEQGLQGQELAAFHKSFMEEALNKAFDDKGRALDPDSLREAKTTLFQQDLLPHTLGRGIQMMAGQVPDLKFVVPFVRTPTNLLRYGWKLTPVLNQLQEEFRLEISGALGAERRAQAIGQYSMGVLFTSYASYLVSGGDITGGGPRDPKSLATLKSTGWAPYSKVFRHPDGTTTYVPFGRIDPMAIPFGIVADIHDAIHNFGEGGEENSGVSQAIGALSIAVIKQFANKQYLQGTQQVLDVLSSDDPKKVETYFRNQAANFVPFSAFTRQANQDPYMREARSVTDKIMSNTPGLSDSLPAKYDWLGEPMLARKGIWSNNEDTLVNTEVQRLIIEAGSTLAGVSPRVGVVDLRDFTLSTGENAFEKYQQLSSRPTAKAPTQRSAIAKLMATDGYKRAPDGEVGLKGSKLWKLHKVQAQYAEAALRVLKADPLLHDALLSPRLRMMKAYKDMKGVKTEDIQRPEGSGLGKLGAAFGIKLEGN
jgi:hypothetical protein